jgi:hypothetical protein
MKENTRLTFGLSPPQFVPTAATFLRPVVKLMLHFHITYPQLISMLKTLYIDVAVADFPNGNQHQSDSRINLLTGIHRKDVKRLRNQSKSHPVGSKLESLKASLGAKIIQKWRNSKGYQDINGMPRLLPLRKNNSQALSNHPLAKQGLDSENLSFDELVTSVAKQDIRPKVILEEWVRLGIAQQEDNCVKLNTDAGLAEKGFANKLAFFGQNIQDHLNAGSHNLMGHKPAYFDRSVFYDKLTMESVDQLTDLANKLGMEALQQMNRTALQLQSEDEELEGNDFRMNFGVFNFNDAQKSTRASVSR